MFYKGVHKTDEWTLLADTLYYLDEMDVLMSVGFEPALEDVVLNITLFNSGVN